MIIISGIIERNIMVQKGIRKATKYRNGKRSPLVKQILDKLSINSREGGIESNGDNPRPAKE
jgi:hypothetical protein